MPHTPRPLTSALAAALAAGTVVAVSAVAEPGADRPARVAASKGWRAAPPLTRLEAIREAAAAREEGERDLARALSIEPARVRAAARAVIARRLGEEVAAERLTAAQRDALLACFDDPQGCDRNALPVERVAGFGPPIAALPPRLAAPPPAPRPRRTGKRPRRLRPALPVPALALSPFDGEFARELGVERERLARALRRTALGRPGRPPRLDPDGVPLGLPSIPVPLVIGAPPPAPVPVPARPPTRPAP